MRLCTIRLEKGNQPALRVRERIVPLSEIGSIYGLDLPNRLIDLIDNVQAITKLNASLRELEGRNDLGLPVDEVIFSPPYEDPPKIWGIGLNYQEHATDLSAMMPDEPASFMKPRTTIIGNGDRILLPPNSSRVTAEAELGVVIAKRCSKLEEKQVSDVIFGYVPVLDMTAEDILHRNPRYLTRAKSFDTFFSFGPFILTQDEIKSGLEDLTISTILNGKVIRSNEIRNMIHSPHRLVAFHSHVFTFEPGDILSTGTPGATEIRNGDVVECRIEGFPALTNVVQ